MDPEYLLGTILKSVFASRRGRKRAKGAMRYVLGNSRVTGMGAMALGGLAYTLYQELTKGGSAAPAPPVTTTPIARGGSMVPPPLPGAASATTPVLPPPLPVPTASVPLTPVGASAAPATPTTPGAPTDQPSVEHPLAPSEIVRVIRLSLSAARADGTLTQAEQDAILGQARLVGAESMIADDLQRPRPLSEIVDGVQGVMQREQLYTIAFAIVRADENLSASERAYLNELATLLGLDGQATVRLEQEAVRNITTAAREGTSRA